jgi:hypothetical protein
LRGSTWRCVHRTYNRHPEVRVQPLAQFVATWWWMIVIVVACAFVVIGVRRRRI